jgi:hypothetical protein
MMLLTKEITMKLPKIDETEATEPPDKVAVVKFFHPASSWTWYGIEFDGDDTFWGLVDGLETEFGYFSLSEISQLVGPFGLKVERDKFFRPTPLRDLAVYGEGGLVY